jgi:hypothetical protein
MIDRRSISRRARVAALCTVAALVTIGDGHRAEAQRDKLTADAIIDRMIEQDPLGYGGAEAHIVMVLINNREQERRRRAVMMSRKDGKTRRMFLRFQSPADIAGTAFLGIDDAGDRIQHLYMPALSRTRRISGRQRNASFVGTDYTYADLDNRDVEDSRKKRLPDEKVGNQDCYVVEARPSSSESAYGRVMLWISKESWLPLRIRFFDAADNEVKRLTVREVKQVEGRWVIIESRMVDLKREHTTVFRVVEIKLRDDIPMEQFSVRALERA